MAEMNKLLYYETQDVIFKEESLWRYRRTFEYYPGSAKESSAKEKYYELLSEQKE